MRFVIPLFALLAACKGGPGQLSSDGLVTQDSAPISNESGGNTSEAATSTIEDIARTGHEGVAGSNESGSVGGFSCLGTFSCTLAIPGSDEKSSKPVTISLEGQCSSKGSAINPNGTITKDGQVVASWRPIGGGGFEYSGTEDEDGRTYSYVARCVKVSDSPSSAGDDDDDSSAPPQETTSGGTK